MDFLSFNPDSIRVFLLLVVRCSAVLFIIPFFGSRNWPLLAKAGLTMLMAFLLYPAARAQNWPLPQDILDFGLVVLAEMLLALCLGLTIHIILAGIQLGGQLVGFQLGFGIVNVLDPQSGAQVSIVAQLAYLIAVLLFLALDGHHLLIMALSWSVGTIKPGVINLSTDLLKQIIGLVLQLFALGIKLVAPAVAALLLTHTAMGIVAKAVPQINVLLMSFPLTISVGLFFFGFCLTLLGGYMSGFVGRDLGIMLNRTVRHLGGG